jgi:hypothetical protein
MRTVLLQCLCLLVLAACAPLAHAQVYHCIGSHGEPVFSGQPCGTPAPPPGNTASAGHHVLGGVCAASPQELRQAITAAFANHDVNRLAGLILWRGVDQASAQAALRSLAAWLKQPLAGIALAYANPPPYANTGPAPAASASIAGPVSQPPTGFEISTDGGDGGTRDFGVIESGGCWWLTF